MWMVEYLGEGLLFVVEVVVECGDEVVLEEQECGQIGVGVD